MATATHQIGAAPQVTLGRGTHSPRIQVGGVHPLRTVAPFGLSSAADLRVDQCSHVEMLVGAGADAVQELSTFGPYANHRAELVARSQVPYGTVLAYEVSDRCRAEKPRNAEEVAAIVLRVVEQQIAQGVDYITIHAALSRDLLDRTSGSRARRAIPIPSRSAAMIMRLMEAHGIDNPFHTAWEKICGLCGAADVLISLGASLRPAAIADALDEAHLLEVAVQGHLARLADRAGAKTVVEGLSHGVPDDLATYCDLIRAHCPSSPVTALGPLTVDVAAGFDHVAAAIGVTFGRLAGLALVNVVTAREHIAMPSAADMRDAIRAAKLGAYAAEVMRVGRSSPQDRAMSEARSSLKWSGQQRHALFPDLFDEIARAEGLTDNNSCSICATKCPFLLPDSVASKQWREPSALE